MHYLAVVENLQCFDVRLEALPPKGLQLGVQQHEILHTFCNNVLSHAANQTHHKVAGEQSKEGQHSERLLTCIAAGTTLAPGMINLSAA